MNHNQNLYSNIDPQLELNRLQQIQLQQLQQQQHHQQFAYQVAGNTINQPNLYAPLGYPAINNNVVPIGFSPPSNLVMNNQGMNIQPQVTSNPIIGGYNTTSPPVYYSQQPPPIYNPQLMNSISPQAMSSPILQSSPNINIIPPHLLNNNQNNNNNTINYQIPTALTLGTNINNNNNILNNKPPLSNQSTTPNKVITPPILITAQNKTIDHENQAEEEEEEEEEEEVEEEEKQSESDYQSEGDEEEEVNNKSSDDDEEDNETYFKKAKQIQSNLPTRKRNTSNKYSIKFLSSDEEEEEEESESDYESPKKKGKKKATLNKGKAGRKKKASISKVEREYEILAATTRGARQRRTTARLYNEITESTGDESEQGEDQEEPLSDKEDSGDDYQSDYSDASDKPKQRSLTNKTRKSNDDNDDVYINNNFDEEEVNSDEEDYTSDSDAGKKRKKKSKRSKKQQFNNQTSNNTMTHLNLRKRNDSSNLMFSEDEENEDHVRGEGGDEYYDEEQQSKLPTSLVVEAPIDEDTIEKVLDHRIKAVAKSENSNDDIEKEMSPDNLVNTTTYDFLVKWKGWAHIHNTWDSYENLVKFKGNKKLINYCKSLIEMVHWRKEASREDIEQADIQRELNRKDYMDYVNVERIIATREVEPTIAAMQQDITTNETTINNGKPPPTTQYLCKWSSLHYCDVTWEFTEDISDKFQKEIDDYLIRTQTQLATKANSISAKRRVEIGFVKLEAQPDYLSAGTLRDYQLEGLNWLAHSWFNNTNVILADEMGLGKTIQTISFLSYLNVEQAMPGPFLVVVPLSTIENWQREFAKWAPHLNVVLYNGASASRSIIREYEFYTYTKAGKKKVSFNVLLTTYEFIVRDKSFLGQIKWDYLAVDEAHRLKNNESALHEVLKLYHTGNRLLVTGTPLQNSLKELWNLLNFLMPNKFHSLNEFQEQYSDLKENDQIAELHSILKPHLLRRIKKDVEKSLPPKTERILRVDFTPLQKKYYKWILSKNFSELNKGVKSEKTTLLNIVTELKKTCNHPYLFESAIQESDGTLESMVKGSGKLILLDKLLIRLKETGHRVLIFSQMVRMLDILADYLRGRSFQFQRLDGSMSNDKRTTAMDRFNAPDSPDFCFLLSTRAGGLGINLTTADTVIIFDSDWNPQNDLQAEARAHRIGQKKQVNIYRLVSKGSIEEDILERAKQKMVLDHLVIQSMEKSATASKNTAAKTFNKDELEKILKFGAADLFKEGDDESNQMPEMDIDEILSRAEPTQNPESVNGEQSAGQELLNSFRVANFSTASTKEDIAWDQIIPDSERKNTSTEEDQIAVLGPRRRGSTLKNMPTLLTHEPLSIKVKPKKDISFFNNKEFKILIRSLKKYGTHKRAKEILSDAKFPVNKPVRSTEDICKEVIDSCRKALSDNREADKVYIVYHGMDINAVEMMQRIQDMEVLTDLCHPHLQDYQNFRVTFPIRPVSWTIKWGPKEDAMLLMGAYKHGIGNWESIKEDSTLGLDDLISINDEKENISNNNNDNENSSNNNNNNNNTISQKVKGSTLLRRLEALIKSATDVYMTKKPKMNKDDGNLKPQVKSLSSRKRIPKNNTKNGGVKKVIEKRKLPKYSDDEMEEIDEIEDDDEDYKPSKAKPSPKKKLKPTNSISKSNRIKNSTTPAPIASPIRTSSGRMSVPPDKLNPNNKVKTPLKSNLFSDDENPSKRSRTIKKPNPTTPTTNELNSDMKNQLSRKCRSLLNPIQKSLEEFRSLSDQKNLSREEKLSKTKKYLLEIGEGIDTLVKSDKSKDTKDSLLKQFWYESSKYTLSNADDLKNLYEKMKKQKEQVPTNPKDNNRN